MLDGQELLKVDQLQRLQTEQDTRQTTRTIFEDAMLEQTQRNQALQESRFRFWGMAHKDGETMVQLKAAMNQVTSFMSQEMPLEEAAFQEQLRSLEGQYQSLITLCDSYISTHRKPFTAAGRARLHLVRNTLNMARRESGNLRPQAERIHRENEAGVAWGNVLGAIRGFSIDLGGADHVGTAGNGTSELLVITEKNRKLFFKEDEKLLPPSEEIQKNYIDGCKDPEDLKILNTLKQLMPDQLGTTAAVFGNQDICKNLQSENPADQLEAFGNLRACLAEYHVADKLDLNHPRVRELIREVMPRYAKWLARRQMCIEACANIQDGSLLSVRNVAASRMAKLLNIQEMVVPAETVTVVDEKTETVKAGIAMPEAAGEDYANLLNREPELIHSPEAVRQLSCLQMFDAICAQVDRNKSNFFASTEKNKEGKLAVSSIRAIDNDMSFGCITYKDLTVKDGINKLPAFAENGHCTLPALDGNMVAALMALDDQVVRYNMLDLISEPEINALLDRIHGIQDEVRRASLEDPTLVVDSDHWDASIADRFRAVQCGGAYAFFRDGGL